MIEDVFVRMLLVNFFAKQTLHGKPFENVLAKNDNALTGGLLNVRAYAHDSKIAITPFNPQNSIMTISSLRSSGGWGLISAWGIVNTCQKDPLFHLLLRLVKSTRNLFMITYIKPAWVV